MTSNQEKACLVGWYRKPEREMIGKFSKAFYFGRQMIVVSLASNPYFKDKIKANELFQNRAINLLVKAGYSYGRALDQLIKQYAPQRIVATGENVNMLSMLIYKRADYLLMSEDEAAELIQRSHFSTQDFQLSHFADALPEDPRHFWCTKQVSDAVISKLNAAIMVRSSELAAQK
jgi:uncharacterized protein (TIGR02285 family)